MADISEDYPENDSRNFGRHTALAALGGFDLLFPGLGYSAQQIASWAVPDPVEKRRADWFNKLSSDLRELSGRMEGFDPKSLGDNEDFITAVMEATPLAIKTHKEAKREAFRNTVLNVAAGHVIDDVLKGRFLQCLDQFSEAHIKVLRILHDPLSHPRVVDAAKNVYMGSPMTALGPEFKAQGVEGDILSVVLADLKQERMIGGGLNVMMSGDSVARKDTTALGDAFLKFIDSPLNAE